MEFYELYKPKQLGHELEYRQPTIEEMLKDGNTCLDSCFIPSDTKKEIIDRENKRNRRKGPFSHN